MSMSKTEAVAVNTLMRALTVAPSRDHDDAKTVVAAIDTLACSASRALGAGVRQGDVAIWHERPLGPIVPTADLFHALDDVRALDPHVWFDLGQQFTCTEANAIMRLLRAVGNPHAAELFIIEHGRGDDGGDEHDLDDETADMLIAHAQGEHDAPADHTDACSTPGCDEAYWRREGIDH